MGHALTFDVPALPDLPRGQVLNVNVPNVPQHMLRGIRRGQRAAFGAAAIDIIETAEDPG